MSSTVFEEFAEESLNPNTLLRKDSLTKKRRNTTILGPKLWLSEYSQINLASIHNQVILTSHHNRTESKFDEEELNSLDTLNNLQKSHSFSTVQLDILNNKNVYQKANGLDFDLFEFVKINGRRNSLTHLALYLLR